MSSKERSKGALALLSKVAKRVELPQLLGTSLPAGAQPSGSGIVLGLNKRGGKQSGSTGDPEGSEEAPPEDSGE